MCRGWPTPRPDLGRRIGVLCQLGAFVATVYLAVVVGGGVLVGESGHPSVVLAVVATGQQHRQRRRLADTSAKPD